MLLRAGEPMKKREGKVQWWLCGLLLLAASPAGAAEIDLSKGQLKHAGDVVVLVIAAKNNTALPDRRALR